jgi:hypothetical protein
VISASSSGPIQRDSGTPVSAKQRHGSSGSDHSDAIRSRARDPNRPGHRRAA